MNRENEATGRMGLMAMRQRWSDKRSGGKARTGWKGAAAEVARTVALALILFLASRVALHNARVEGESMLPTLQSGQQLLVNKLAYLRYDPGLVEHLAQGLVGGATAGDPTGSKAGTAPPGTAAGSGAAASDGGITNIKTR